VFHQERPGRASAITVIFLEDASTCETKVGFGSSFNTVEVPLNVVSRMRTPCHRVLAERLKCRASVTLFLVVLLHLHRKLLQRRQTILQQKTSYDEYILISSLHIPEGFF
jgi:hypothetical protein